MTNIDWADLGLRHGVPCVLGAATGWTWASVRGLQAQITKLRQFVSMARSADLDAIHTLERRIRDLREAMGNLQDQLKRLERDR